MRPRSKTKSKILRTIYDLLYPIYSTLLEKYFHKMIRDVFVSERFSTFSYDCKLESELTEGETIYGEHVRSDYSEKKISAISLTPLMRNNDIIAFIVKHDWLVTQKYGGGQYAESVAWIVSREPLKITISFRPQYIIYYYEELEYDFLDSFDPHAPRERVEEREAIVDSELFMRCLNTYLEAYRIAHTYHK